MGLKQSSPAANARLRAYSGSDVPTSTSTTAGSGSTSATAIRYYTGNQQQQQVGARGRYAADGARPNSLFQPSTTTTIIAQGNGTPSDEDAVRERSQSGPRLLIGSLPSHLSPHLLGAGFSCPVCSKFVASDEIDLHLVMCLTKPRLSYNEDILIKDSGECAICLDEMVQGDTIARLPCLCIYHKGCIDEWFEVNRSCPEHPTD